jgi:hypothetical protein
MVLFDLPVLDHVFIDEDVGDGLEHAGETTFADADIDQVRPGSRVDAVWVTSAPAVREPGVVLPVLELSEVLIGAVCECHGSVLLDQTVMAEQLAVVAAGAVVPGVDLVAGCETVVAAATLEGPQVTVVPDAELGGVGIAAPLAEAASGD